MIGEAIRQRRNLVGLSQAELGPLAGVHRNTARRAETGGEASGSTLSRLALSLGCVPRRIDGEAALKPVFSAPTTRVVTRAILAMADCDYSATLWRELVAAVAAGEPIPWYQDFRHAISGSVTQDELASIDAEIGPRIVGGADGAGHVEPEPVEGGAVLVDGDTLRALDAAMRAEGVGVDVRRRVVYRIAVGGGA